MLKSPIGGASDEDLILLARAGEGSWWQRLSFLYESADQSETIEVHSAVSHVNTLSSAMGRIVPLLRDWQHASARLPVHDLLDKVMHQGQLAQRYASSLPASMRAQVLGNLDAFVALSLEVDAGRYPSIARFIDTLRRLQRASDQEAPNEADIDVSADAVRIMTIHGAKGLEASVVVLMGSNHSDSTRDPLGVLFEWPQRSLIHI